MMAPRYTSDIDAARLTLVRSLENIQKALPENRRRGTQSISAALAFELGENNNGSSSTLVTPISRVVERDDDAWKKHLRPSEIMALEGQLEILQQDMRDLNSIQARHVQNSRQQWQYAREEERISQRHRLRRVGEVAVLPQAISQEPNSSSDSSTSASAAADKGSRLPYPTSSSSGGRFRKQQQKYQSTMERQPLMQKPVGSRDIRPIHTKVNPRSGNSLSKAVTTPRYQAATTPEVISPTSTNVSSSLVEEVQQYMNEYNGWTVNRRLMASQNLVESESSHKTRRSSLSSGVKRHSIGERKVRFAEEDIQGSQEQTKELVGRTDKSQAENSLSRSSSSSSLSSSSSIPRTVTSSSRKDNQGLFDTHSLSTDDGETPLRNPTRTQKKPDGTLAESQSMADPQTQINISASRNGRAGMTQNRKSLLVRFFSRRSRSNGSASSRDSKSSGRRPTPSKWGSTSSGSSLYEQGAPVSGPMVSGNEPKSIVPPSLPNAAGDGRSAALASRANSTTNTPIRSLLRKHSVSLLNKFTGKDCKATSAPLGAVPEGAQEQPGLTCVVCLEEFARSSVIQVPGECSHSYCKGCLKDDPHGSFPVKCCGITTIDVSVADTILSANKIARYNELMIEHETADRSYCYNKRCSTFIPPANIKLNEAKCPKCRRITCTHCKKEKHRGVCVEDRDSMELEKTLDGCSVTNVNI